MDVYIRENAGIYWLRKLDSAIKKAFTYVEANQEKQDAYREIIKVITNR